MSLTAGDAPTGAGGVPASPGPSVRPGVPRSGDVLARAEGLQMVGELRGSGYREAPSLVRRADGQTISLTPLLYLVLEAVDGHRTDEEVAAHVSSASGRIVDAANVRTLVDGNLRPLGLLRLADGSQPQVKKANPLLGLRLRLAVSDPQRTRWLTAPFARLFHPLLALPLVAGFLVVCWWLLLEKGLASATYEAFDRPALLMLIFVLSVLSAGFHEFGHAAAARYGGATPGVMGMGVYLVWPAFYTDVTDSYRLGRWGRVRTDLGGLYFNAIVAVGIVAAWWSTGHDALLLVVVTQILQMVRQLAPLVRFDGYHLLADVTGVPDLFHRIKPTLLGVLPWRWRSAESRVLKPWARAVVTVWVLLVVPLLLGSLVLMVVALPRVLATAWASVQEQWQMLLDSWFAGDLLDASGRGLSVVAVAFPVLAIVYILVRVVRQVVTVVWRRTSGRPVQRTLAAAAAAALVAGLLWAWWPDGDTYRPIRPYERGTLVDAVPSSILSASGLQEGARGELQTIWPAGLAMPTADDPQLALVLVPRTGDDGARVTGARVTGTGAGATQPVATRDGGTNATDDGAFADDAAGEVPQEIAPSWVFPFDPPPEPGPGDNQALAVNTGDGSVVYDVAFALVWVEDDHVLNTNEAYALASCRDCTTVAVGFQVLLVAGQADVVVPQNIAAAVNYNCVGCLTYALATQLVVTLDGPLSSTGTAALEKLWAEIAAFGDDIEDVPLSELQARLSAYEQRILDIIAADRSVSPAPTTAAGSSPGSVTATATTTAADGTGGHAGNATADAEDDAPGGTGSTGSSQDDVDGTGTTGSTGGSAAGSSQPTGGTSAAQESSGAQTGSGPTAGPSSQAPSPSPSPSPSSTTPSPTASPSG